MGKTCNHLNKNKCDFEQKYEIGKSFKKQRYTNGRNKNARIQSNRKTHRGDIQKKISLEGDLKGNGACP